jgi:two-component system response regulator YesN
MDKRVQKVIELMENELRRDLPLGRMATAVNLTPSRLCRLFKAETGASPVQYLRLMRMRRAKNLLENSFLRVKEVMDMVGVRDSSHFVRDFKRTYGLTPVQYRAHRLSTVHGPDEGTAKS